MSSVTCGSRNFLTIEGIFWAVLRRSGRKQRPTLCFTPSSAPAPDLESALWEQRLHLLSPSWSPARRRLRKDSLGHRSPRPTAPLTRSPAASTPCCESVAKPMRLPSLSPKSASFSMVENHCRNRFRKMLLYECRPGVSRFSSDGGKQPYTPIHGFFSVIKHNILGQNSV